MSTHTTIEQALAAALPPEQRVYAAELAALFGLPPAEIATQLAARPALRDALAALVGRTLEVAGAPLHIEGNLGTLQQITISGGYVERIVGTAITIQLPPPAPATQPNKHQLRAPVADFVGREAEIAELTAALTSGAAATISGLAGMGGIGKTELAMVVANQLVERFPDAQIVLSLQGSREPALPATDALRDVIRALKPEAQLPDDERSLVAAYRSVLTGKQVLILADDAKDAAQVRPLMPPTGSALLITSRQRFILEGMRRVDLERLGAEEAVALLRSICERLSDDEARQIAAGCGRLPLALRIAGGVLAKVVC